MDYAEALAAISGLDIDGKDDILNAIKGEVQKKGQESKSVREKLRSLESQVEGLDLGNTKKVIEALKGAEIDLAGDVSAQLANLTKGAKGAEGKDAELQKVLRNMQTMQKQMADMQAASEAKDKALRTEKIKGALSGVFQERVLNPRTTLEYHVSNGDFTTTESGEIAYVRGGEHITGSVNDVVAAFLTDNKDAARETTRPGTGGAPGSGKPTGKTMTMAEFQALPPREQGRVIDEVDIVD